MAYKIINIQQLSILSYHHPILTNWRDQLDTLEPVKDQNGKIIEQGIHKVPGAPGDEKNSYLNRFDSVLWSPDGKTALIVGGAWTDQEHFQDMKKTHPHFPEQYFPSVRQGMFYFGGGSVLSFHGDENKFKLPNIRKDTNTVKYRPEFILVTNELLESIRKNPLDFTMYKFWDAAWRPILSEQNTAVIVGERWGRVFKCIQSEQNNPLEIEELPIQLNGEIKRSPDILTLLWKQDGTCAFLTGDKDDPVGKNNWRLEFPSWQFYDDFVNKAFDEGNGEAINALAWHPKSNYALAAGGIQVGPNWRDNIGVIYKCNVDIAGNLVIPKDTVGQLHRTEIRVQGDTLGPIANFGWGICWVPPKNDDPMHTYAIITGGFDEHWWIPFKPWFSSSSVYVFDPQSKNGE